MTQAAVPGSMWQNVLCHLLMLRNPNEFGKVWITLAVVGFKGNRTFLGSRDGFFTVPFLGNPLTFLPVWNIQEDLVQAKVTSSKPADGLPGSCSRKANCSIACEIACHKTLMISVKGISSIFFEESTSSWRQIFHVSSVIIQTRSTFVEKSCTVNWRSQVPVVTYCFRHCWALTTKITCFNSHDDDSFNPQMKEVILHADILIFKKMFNLKWLFSCQVSSTFNYLFIRFSLFFQTL